MDDLISRAAAIDYCYQLINVEHQQGSDKMNYGWERVSQTETILHHLEIMPSAQPEPQWTSCAKRLPEANGNYLVTGRQGAVNKRKFEDGRWYGNWAVTAWMPLPARYKEDTDD